MFSMLRFSMFFHVFLCFSMFFYVFYVGVFYVFYVVYVFYVFLCFLCVKVEVFYVFNVFYISYGVVTMDVLLELSVVPLFICFVHELQWKNQPCQEQVRVILGRTPYKGSGPRFQENSLSCIPKVSPDPLPPPILYGYKREFSQNFGPHPLGSS